MSTHLWVPDAENLQKANILIRIGTEGPVIRIVAVGGHQHVFRRHRPTHRHYHRRMAEVFSVKRELDQVAGAQIPQFAGMGRRAFGFFLPDEEVIEVGHAGPRRGLLVRVDIVPTEGGCEVHHAAAGVNALGGEVGAVAP